ncbi:DUF1836 domain-containing protein [bacterium c-19]|nr:DUF1836 domain-containing protein [bacterium c-19]
MNEKELDQLKIFAHHLSEYRLPRWEELPDFDIYMDQVITLIERYLNILNDGKQQLITSAMVNNYVKLKLIPKPIKKKYNKEHIAYLIAITLLKQILTISEVRDGITYQAKISGTHIAYNLYCEEQEKAFHNCAVQIMKNAKLPMQEDIEYDAMVVKMAAQALAQKLVAQKIVYIQRDTNGKEKEHEK